MSLPNPTQSNLILLFFAETYIHNQILEKKNDVIVPDDLWKIKKRLFEFTFRGLYQKTFPNFLSEKVTLLADNVAFTCLWLSGALLCCFHSTATNYMDQMKSRNMLLSSSSALDFYKELHPQITRINTVDFLVISFSLIINCQAFGPDLLIGIG